MIKRQTTPQAFRMSMLLLLMAAAVLAACAPSPSPAEIQKQIQDSVAQTVEAQNSMATQVAGTVSAMMPAGVATATPTSISLTLPTLTPIVPTVTPFVVPPAGGSGSGSGSGSGPKYACDVYTRPFDNTAYKPGDPFDIKWIITNTGSETWIAGLDFDYFSGPHLTTKGGVELPEIKPGHSYTFTADANAPLEKGHYVMTWRVQGGFCWPYVAIISGKPGDP